MILVTINGDDDDDSDQIGFNSTWPQVGAKLCILYLFVDKIKMQIRIKMQIKDKMQKNEIKHKKANQNQNANSRSLCKWK